jgi:hypothetical protein
LARPDLINIASDLPQVTQAFNQSNEIFQGARNAPGGLSRAARGPRGLNLESIGGDVGVGRSQDVFNLAFQNLIQRLSNEFLL